MSRDPLDILWKVADVSRPIFSPEELAGLPPGCSNELIGLGVLREGEPATHVTCDGCHGQHVERVDLVRDPRGHVRFFIPCPENFCVEVPRERLQQWAVDFLPLLKLIAKSLGTRETPLEQVPDRVWNLGRASLAGRSRPIWVARGLAWPDARQVAAALPQGRAPVLFFLGQPPEDGLVDLPHESVIELRTVVRLDGQVSVDRQAIESQLADIIVPERKVVRKQAARDAIVGALKRELHDHLVAFKSAIRAAEEAGRDYVLPRVTQKELARAISATESTVSRAIASSNDPLLKFMLDALNDPDQIRKYKR